MLKTALSFILVLENSVWKTVEFAVVTLLLRLCSGAKIGPTVVLIIDLPILLECLGHAKAESLVTVLNDVGANHISQTVHWMVGRIQLITIVIADFSRISRVLARPAQRWLLHEIAFIDL